MISRTTDRFWQSYNSLPKEVKKKAKKTFQLFQKELHHPGLHFKRIHSAQNVFSIRISRKYRALGVVQKEDIIWFWIGSYSDYNNLIKSIKEKGK